MSVTRRGIYHIPAQEETLAEEFQCDIRVMHNAGRSLRGAFNTSSLHFEAPAVLASTPPSLTFQDVNKDWAQKEKKKKNTSENLKNEGVHYAVFVYSEKEQARVKDCKHVCWNAFVWTMNSKAVAAGQVNINSSSITQPIFVQAKNWESTYLCKWQNIIFHHPGSFYYSAETPGC